MGVARLPLLLSSGPSSNAFFCHGSCASCSLPPSWRFKRLVEILQVLHGSGVMMTGYHGTQRLLYSKYFTHLTSSRRARNSCLPHFRLNKVRKSPSKARVGKVRHAEHLWWPLYRQRCTLLVFVCADRVSMSSHMKFNEVLPGSSPGYSSRGATF